MRIAFLHTADVHVATFDRLLDAMAPGAERRHRVEPGWLARARRDGLTPDLRRIVMAALHDFGDVDCVVCTCSTLGPVADAVSAITRNVFRVDRPMMEEAVSFGPDVLVALCLESTRDATLELLADAAGRAGRAVRAATLDCTDAWPHFEAGDVGTFARAVAGRVAAHVATQGPPGCVVLSQASMAVAEPFLLNLGVPVLSSPRLAVHHAIALGAGAGGADPIRAALPPVG